MSKSVKSHFSDDSFSSLFDVELPKSIKKSYAKYILLLLLLFSIMSIVVVPLLFAENKEEELV